MKYTKKYIEIDDMETKRNTMTKRLDNAKNFNPSELG